MVRTKCKHETKKIGNQRQPYFRGVPIKKFKKTISVHLQLIDSRRFGVCTM